jgi:hypothetical protein
VLWKKVIELQHHAVLVYETVLFAEGRTLFGFQVTFKIQLKVEGGDKG